MNCKVAHMYGDIEGVLDERSSKYTPRIACELILYNHVAVIFNVFIASRTGW